MPSSYASSSKRKYSCREIPAVFRLVEAWS
jgi:hypothetical protein